MKLLFMSVLCSVLAVPALSYRILCIFSIPSKSHNHLAKGIVDSLLQAGHEVTWATPYPKENTKKLQFIDLSANILLADAIDMTNPKYAKAGPWLVKEFSRNMTLNTMRSESLKKTLVKDQYDAVITEWFFSDLEAGYAAIQQVPWILLQGVTLQPEVEGLVDEVRSISTVPLMVNQSPIPMGLWGRLLNVAMYTMLNVEGWLEHSSVKSIYTSLYEPLAKARGIPLTAFDEAARNVSVVFVNCHPTFAPAKSVPPNVIDIGGYHIEEDGAPLPKDLQDILDSSKCVVYFSMGSVMKTKVFPAKTTEQLLNIFAKVQCTVLWKFEPQPGAPANVHFRSWFPQASILAHPKVKLFITHGGLLSTLEALHYGVPLLAIPVFGDQPANAKRAVLSGFARMVEYSPELAGEFQVELLEMLRNDRYYNTAKYLSKLFRNRPVSPKKLISHYVELAIESKGAYHLRSPSTLYAWYERWLIDVLAVILIVFFIIYAVIRAIVRIIKRKLCPNKKQKVKTR